MKPYRPKNLEDLNVDFFSGNTEKTTDDEILTDSGEFDVSEEMPPQEQFSDIFPEITEMPEAPKEADEPSESKDPAADKQEFFDLLMQKLSSIDDSKPINSEFDAVPAYTKKSPEKESILELADDSTYTSESIPPITESIIDLAAKRRDQSPDDPKEREKDAIRRAKDDAKASIENEKKKIKAQKKLENTVQRPFGKRKTAIIMLVVFLVIGILATAVSTLMYAVEKSDNGMINLAGFTVAYVDADKVSGDEHIGRYIFSRSGSIQGNDTLFFLSAADIPTVADVIGFGDGLYAVNLGSSIYRVEQSKILGSVKFETPQVAILRSAVSGYTFVVYAVLAIYFILVILFSSLRIGKLNAAIRRLEESYELI